MKMIFNTVFRTDNRDEQNTSIDSKTSLDFHRAIINKIARADFADSRGLSKSSLTYWQRNRMHRLLTILSGKKNYAFSDTSKLTI